MPTISVIVPIYNSEKYLNRCVDSILNQTFKDFELILVDDGSPDRCGKICDEYAEKDSRVSVIHKENGGVSSARNAGLDYVFSESFSKYISFVDSDDWLKENAYEELVSCINGSKSDFAVCCFITVDGEKEYSDNGIKSDLDIIEHDSLIYWTFPHVKKEKTTYPYYHMSPGIFNKLFTAELCRNIRFEEDIKYGEDYLFLLQAFLKCKSCCVCRKNLYYYFISPDSLSRKPDVDYYYLSFVMSERRLKICNYDTTLYNWALHALINNYLGFIHNLTIKHKYKRFIKDKKVLCKYKSTIKKADRLHVKKFMPELFFINYLPLTYFLFYNVKHFFNKVCIKLSKLKKYIFKKR